MVANLISVDTVSGSASYKRFVGFSSTVLTSFSITSAWGSAWDGTNVYTSTHIATVLGTFRKHSGFSATVSSSFARVEAEEAGIDWNGTNFLSGNRDGTGKFRKYTGFTSIVLSSFSITADQTNDIGWTTVSDASGDLVRSRAGATDKWLRHTGFSATINNSFIGPSTAAGAATWRDDTADLIGSDTDADKFYQFSGFSSTIENSFILAGSWIAATWERDFPATPVPSKGGMLLLMGVG